MMRKDELDRLRYDEHVDAPYEDMKSESKDSLVQGLRFETGRVF